VTPTRSPHQVRHCVGGVVSPVLANLFMHYAFDAWMDREHPGVTFSRYVDDVVVHAITLGQAERLRSAIAARMVQVGLELHPVKTKIVYCKVNNRRGAHEHESFTFLGFTFRARSARDKHGVIFASFLPAVRREALNRDRLAPSPSRRVRRRSRPPGAGASPSPGLGRWPHPGGQGDVHARRVAAGGPRSRGGQAIRQPFTPAYRPSANPVSAGCGLTPNRQVPPA